MKPLYPRLIAAWTPIAQAGCTGKPVDGLAAIALARVLDDIDREFLVVIAALVPTRSFLDKALVQRRRAIMLPEHHANADLQRLVVARDQEVERLKPHLKRHQEALGTPKPAYGATLEFFLESARAVDGSVNFQRQVHRTSMGRLLATIRAAFTSGKNVKEDPVTVKAAADLRAHMEKTSYQSAHLLAEDWLFDFEHLLPTLRRQVTQTRELVLHFTRVAPTKEQWATLDAAMARLLAGLVERPPQMR